MTGTGSSGVGLEKCAPATLFLLVGETYKAGWATLNLMLLLWIFVGLTVMADVFMESIATVTSAQCVKVKEIDGVETKRHYRFWNPTVANLTLMALGSSAPEILLATIELVGHNFHSGHLGAATVMGSAAFNLSMIPALCTVSLANPKRVTHRAAICFTAFMSFWAYAWFWIVLEYVSPGVVEIWEAALTLGFAVVLVFGAYMVDKLTIVRKPIEDSSELTSSKHCLPCSKQGHSALENQTEPAELVTVVETPTMIETITESDALNNVQRRRSAKNLLRTSGYQDTEMPIYLKARQVAHLVRYKNMDHLGRASRHRMALKFLIGKRKEALEPTEEETACLDQGFQDCPIMVDILPEQGAPIVSFEVPSATVKATAQTYSVKLFLSWESPVDIILRVTTNSNSPTFAQIENTVEFLSGTKEQTLTLQLMPVKQANAFSFWLEMDLYGMTLLKPGKVAIHSVVLLAKASKGIVTMVQPSLSVIESIEYAIVRIVRTRNLAEHCSLHYYTQDQQAVANVDYVPISGNLEFHPDEFYKELKVAIIDDTECEDDETFLLILEEPIGCSFDPRTDGGNEREICQVTIIDDDTRNGYFQRVSSLLHLNFGRIKSGGHSWKTQFREAIFVYGSRSAQAHATCTAWVSHLIALPWKLIAALMPPHTWLGGWLGLITALSIIGFEVLLVTDLANGFCCAAKVPSLVAAITVLAVGTSLADALASRYAAIVSHTADDAIGNITGSNAINVYVGLGLPWLIGSIYWKVKNQLDYNGGPTAVPGSFYVPSLHLDFLVFYFIGINLLVYIVLILRRIYYGGEIGGRYRHVVALFFTFLWLSFVIMSTLRSLEHI